MGKFPPRADGSEGDPFRGRSGRGERMERNGGIVAVYRRHAYLRRDRIKKKSRAAATDTTQGK